MKRWMVGAVLLVLSVGAACAQAQTGRAVIKATTAQTQVAGTATLTDTPEGLRVVVQVTGAPPGEHGIHIHELGSCDEAGKAAGGHYDPEHAPHGLLPKDGPAQAHAGDMGNITVGADGTGALDIVLPGVALSTGAHTVQGRAIILHEQLDDFGQPVGNAGGRIGCGTIEVTAGP